MSQHVLKVGDTIKISNLNLKIRKITKKDIILREVKQPVSIQAEKQATEKQATEEQATETQPTEEPPAEEKNNADDSSIYASGDYAKYGPDLEHHHSAIEEDLFEKTF